jgi:hypothetical protein
LIRPLKEAAKRHWPALRLRTLLFLTLLFVAALPGIGAVFLRVYENTLVQQTEAELIAQGAVLAGAYRAAWPEPYAEPPPAAPRPERPTIDLNAMPILGEQPAARPSGKADGRAIQVAAALRPVVVDTGRSTLAAIRLMDMAAPSSSAGATPASATPICPKFAARWPVRPGRCFAAAATIAPATRSNG